MLLKEGLLRELTDLKKDLNVTLKKIKDLDELRELEIKFLGKKSRLVSITTSLRDIPEEDRRIAGKVLNETKLHFEVQVTDLRNKLNSIQITKSISSDNVDITLPGKRSRKGHRHVLHQVIEEITLTFLGLGYTVAEGPEIELDYFNFEALNIPIDHPARSLQDTLYITSKTDDVLLRTHTSPVQIRVMKEQKPPLFILAPGRVYRRDVVDPTHSPIFHQIEGFVVDIGITFTDLKGTLEHFAHETFGPDRNVRLRPSYFPFTEPSAEVDVSCGICSGKGCRSCGGSGWLEILGAGMIDPNVLSEVGIDPEIYSGFAFGMGVERIAMLKYGITDIRSFFENDLRFLNQF